MCNVRIDGCSASKMLHLKEEAKTLKIKVIHLEKRIMQLDVLKVSSVPSKQVPTCSSVVSNNHPAAYIMNKSTFKPFSFQIFYIIKLQKSF